MAELAKLTSELEAEQRGTPTIYVTRARRDARIATDYARLVRKHIVDDERFRAAYLGHPSNAKCRWCNGIADLAGSCAKCRMKGGTT